MVYRDRPSLLIFFIFKNINSSDKAEQSEIYGMNPLKLLLGSICSLVLCFLLSADMVTSKLQEQGALDDIVAPRTPAECFKRNILTYVWNTIVLIFSAATLVCSQILANCLVIPSIHIDTSPITSIDNLVRRSAEKLKAPLILATVCTILRTLIAEPLPAMNPFLTLKVLLVFCILMHVKDWLNLPMLYPDSAIGFKLTRTLLASAYLSNFHRYWCWLYY